MPSEIQYHVGDIFEYLSCGSVDAGEHIVLHSCNARGVMGSGFAKTVKQKFPNCFEAYTHGLSLNTSPYQSLGTFSIAQCELGGFEFTIFNLIGQLNYGSDPSVKYTSYDALDTCLREIDSFLSVVDTDINFHFPRIGSVRGGGSWEVVREIIQHRLNRSNYKLNLWELKNG